jgi:Fic family protein
MLQALSRADLCLGRLDGIARRVPNPDLFVAMYVRQEAVLSSQIEGTQASLTDVLQFEAGLQGEERLKDAEEVSNHVRAMNLGLQRLETLPLSKRLVREIHGILLEDTRGGQLTPGEFRKTQNWIGAPGCTLATARFVPPPPHALHDALDAWERFLHDDSLPAVIQAALAHAQFETIHPFLDGNGRIGRLLITFLLCTRGVLKRPLLYLSAYLKKNRAEYYDRLQAVRDHGHWEQWVKFFLRGIAAAASDATDTADKILDLQTKLREQVTSDARAANLLRAVDYLFLHPPRRGRHGRGLDRREPRHQGRRGGREGAARQLRAGPRAVQRFRTEAEAAVRIGHPSIVQGVRLRPVPGRRALPGDGAPPRGEPRRRAWSARAPPRARPSTAWSRCSRPRAAHDKDILHRDLKPENIFLARAGELIARRSSTSACRRSSATTPSACA